MKLLRALEAGLVRVEGGVAVALVLVMLMLAGYNVVYRNVLVALQKHWAHSGPPVTATNRAESPTGAAQAPTRAGDKAGGAPEDGKSAAAEGFAGDWGEGGDEDAPDPEPAAVAAAEGFAGDWGEGGAEEPAQPDQAGKSAGAAEGFAGDWGEGGDGDGDDEAAPAKPSATPATPAAIEPDDEFAKLTRIDAAPGNGGDASAGGPPPVGSFAAQMVALIDAVKLPWIDVVLRQLVIIVSFFGAMMATQRGKHINVDALSKFIGPRGQRWLSVATNLLATVVCVIFARAGANLVAISREHPHELVPWADEWLFQLMFPMGFGLLAFHFAVRVAECALGQAPPAAAGQAGGVG